MTAAIALSAKRLILPFVEASKKRSLLQRVRDYRGFISIEFENNDFHIGTAMTGPHLLKALELRHEVFLQEWQGRRAWHGLDVDNFDFHADHLLITNKKSGRVVGTYRLLSSHFTTNFYSSSEFDLQEFLRLPSVKLEMGRACIDARYRNGATINLLWKGLAKYIAASKTEFLFGCSSFKSLDAVKIARLYRTLSDDGNWSDDYKIRPVGPYRMQPISIAAAQPLSSPEKRDLIPPLLRSYLLAGAQVHGFPAADRDFGCADLLTILEWKKLSKQFQQHFLPEEV